jgi:purine-binding chemotaxis protein CheW
MLLCRARALVCALPLAHVVETMRPLPIDVVGGAPEFVTGVSRIRGEHMPVVDLGRILGLPDDAVISRFVILRYGGRSVALGVEGIIGVGRIPRATSNALPPLLKGAREGAVTALRDRDAELLLVLDTARLLPTMPEGRA